MKIIAALAVLLCSVQVQGQTCASTVPSASCSSFSCPSGANCPNQKTVCTPNAAPTADAITAFCTGPSPDLCGSQSIPDGCGGSFPVDCGLGKRFHEVLLHQPLVHRLLERLRLQQRQRCTCSAAPACHVELEIHSALSLTLSLPALLCSYSTPLQTRLPLLAPIATAAPRPSPHAAVL
jgi:hypothetical protein